MAQGVTLTVAMALTAGMVAHAVARHARVPTIAVLLAAGVLLGPDGAGLVQPRALGGGLYSLVDTAVAVILFEGGLRLSLRRLRREPAVIRRLVTVGALISAAGGAGACRLALGWGWRDCGLFGILVMVTGPTVITPLVDGLRVRRRVAAVLEAEGVLIDAIGAVTAAVALDLAIRPTEEGALLAAPGVALRLGTGTAIGFAGGALLAVILGARRLLPYDLRNVFVLAVVVLLHAGSDAVLPHSGLAAAAAAGITLANMPRSPMHSLLAFNQQLVHLLIGMLFLLLVADVRLADVLAVGWPGLATVALLALVVRPVMVAACAAGSRLSWKERALVAWLGPRGVVAAAVASLVALELSAAGQPGGRPLRALVFMTIAVTVAWSSLTAPFVAARLGLRRRARGGWVVLGGNALALELAQVLQEAGEQAVVVESDPHLVRDAEGSGIRALHGNAYEDRTLARADLEGRRGAVALTSNPDANLLFVQQARAAAPDTRFFVAVRDHLDGVTPAIVGAGGAEILFAGPADVSAWSKRLRAGQARSEWWRYTGELSACMPAGPCGPFIPLLKQSRTGSVLPVGERTRLSAGDSVAFLIDRGRREQARELLGGSGYEPVGPARSTVPPVMGAASGWAAISSSLFPGSRRG
ncbi:MAG: cation:proton antiporter [Myxococcales bacterium]|jgi:NhaP-type Na+/H+ or K+/H+ antiporter